MKLVQPGRFVSSFFRLYKYIVNLKSSVTTGGFPASRQPSLQQNNQLFFFFLSIRFSFPQRHLAPSVEHVFDLVNSFKPNVLGGQRYFGQKNLSNGWDFIPVVFKEDSFIICCVRFGLKLPGINQNRNLPIQFIRTVARIEQENK